MDRATRTPATVGPGERTPACRPFALPVMGSAGVAPAVSRDAAVPVPRVP